MLPLQAPLPSSLSELASLPFLLHRPDTRQPSLPSSSPLPFMSPLSQILNITDSHKELMISTTFLLITIIKNHTTPLFPFLDCCRNPKLGSLHPHCLPLLSSLHYKKKKKKSCLKCKHHYNTSFLVKILQWLFIALQIKSELLQDRSLIYFFGHRLHLNCPWSFFLRI